MTDEMSVTMTDDEAGNHDHSKVPAGDLAVGQSCLVG